LGQEIDNPTGHDQKRLNLTRLDTALDMLYRGRCNLVQACQYAEIDSEVMKSLLLDRVKNSFVHPLQLTLNFYDQNQ
jgi:hypothetical protein